MQQSSMTAPNDISPETLELAMELQQLKPDEHLIHWLINDREADLASAMQQAQLVEEDLMKKPQLRRLHLQQHLRKPKST